MFVRIIVRVDEVEKNSLYECERVHVRQHDGTKVDVDMEGPPISVRIEDKKYSVIYLMNNNGKTIDTYRWS